MTKIGFMFGAGAEMSYDMPSGGDFALNIFRVDSTENKEKFKSQRPTITKDPNYRNWLPEKFETKQVNVFGKKAYEDIIHSTVEQNREMIIKKINELDKIAKQIACNLQNEQIDINAAFKIINDDAVSNSSISNNIKYIDELNEGTALFQSHYFSALILAYKNLKKNKNKASEDLGKIILFILQLQIGALGEKLAHKLNEGIFEKNDSDLDILDDLGDFVSLNYQAVGQSGLEYLLAIQKSDSTQPEDQVLTFAQILLEKIYASVLDYKILIDSNWMYLYQPKTDWSKFCKIHIFLHNVRNYIHKIYKNTKPEALGYYDDINQAVQEHKIEICAAATSNYTPLIQDRLNYDKTIYLNGSTSLYYDPFLNRIGTEKELKDLKHFIVPLIFTQSGTKPMTSIRMSAQYVEYYNALAQADEICVIGYNFNNDDDHINCLFRDLVKYKNKHITLITLKEQDSEDTVKQKFADKLKLQDASHISVMLVDSSRQHNNSSWLESLLA